MCAYARRRKYILLKSKPVGSFSFIVKLENVLGLLEGYAKVTYGMQHKLILVRKSDDDAIYKLGDPAADGRVKLS